MPSQGYIRFPTIYQDRIVFVSEDDLWLISSEGGRAERLTAGLGRITHPHFSRDGQLLAFVSREEGPSEVYIMPAYGGPAKRLTFQASSCRVLGWSSENDAIIFTSSAGQCMSEYKVIYAISPEGGEPRQLPVGMASAIAYGPQGGIVIGRNVDDLAYWKRYRGGRVGHLWCDKDSSGAFQRLLHLKGNIADPCWIGERIYFISDHEGIGNIYSCTPEGEDLQRHTDQQKFYARHLSSDETRMVFQAGADLYLFDPGNEEVRHVPVQLPSQRTQLNRKFVSAFSYLDTIALHPQGHALALTTRGKAFSLSNWEGAAIQQGERDGVRYRFLEWLNDGKRLIAICDTPGREALAIFDPQTDTPPKVLSEIDFGRVVEMSVSPTDDIVAIANHRHELTLIDLQAELAIVIDRSDYERIQDLAWAPDGTWLAYSFAISAQKKAIKLADLESGTTHIVTEPVLEDVAPSFDPDGKYLYFLGYRIFNPVYDNMQFEMSFPRGVQPYAITLRHDLRSPFINESRLQSERWIAPPKLEPEQSTVLDSTIVEDQEEVEKPLQQDQNIGRARSFHIDLEGITGRAIPFPVPEGRYIAIHGIRGKVLFHIAPIVGALSPMGALSRSWVEYYDFETQRVERYLDGVNSLHLSRDNRWLLYRSRYRYRVLKAGEKASRDAGDYPGRESGWVDLDRVKVSIQPASEWKQMFAEAWRLQREQFWTEDMSGVDWDAIYAQYSPLVERVGSRAELSDLIHELQGELGTSHTYEYKGDYRQGNHYYQGFLGVDWMYDSSTQRYRIAHIVRGDPSSKDATSPLTSPGLHVTEGDAVLAINGQNVGPNCSPQELLVNQAGSEIQLTIEAVENKEIRVITVTTLFDESTARYRDWVECNRQTVHAKSQGRVGYVHIPNMKALGYAEFHRSYLAEYDYPALIIDVRWNEGGNVSELLLEKLARRRLGYKFSRWGQPRPYPAESPRGPLVALTNEHAGSDGDIFSHNFKLMGLGPLIGKRTWGGVIGISPRHLLVDGTYTTQPEYANWFKDIGWDLENYGTAPDIEVDIAPQDYTRDVDPQLERAIEEALRLAEEYPTLEPKTGERPRKNR